MNKIEERLKSAYFANGGTEADFQINKQTLVEQYRQTAAVNTVLQEAQRPPNVNDLIRTAIRDTPNGERIRLFANDEGTHNDAA